MIPILYAELIDDRRDCVLFEEFYALYAKQMYYVARGVLREDMEAEDAVHDAFIGIARNMKTVAAIQLESDRRSYVLQAAQNAAISRLRKIKHLPELLEPEVLDQISENGFIEKLLRAEDCQQVIAAIKALPDIYCDVLWLHYVLGLTMEQVVETLGIKPSAAKQRLTRGRKMLLDGLEERGVFTRGSDKSRNY